ncbi:hypothetical protein ACS0TY_006348 [Phlomoides rotata]
MRTAASFGIQFPAVRFVMLPRREPNRDAIADRLDALTQQLGTDVQLLQAQTSTALAGRADHLQDHNRKWELSFKLDIPEFHGNIQPGEFLDWLIAIEEVLDFKDVPADSRITFEDVLNLLSPTSIYEAHQRALALEKQFNRPSLALPFPFVARQIASNPATETLASSSRPTPSPGPPRGTSPHPPPAPPDTTQRGQFPPAFPPAHGPCFPAGRLGTACPSALGRVLLMAC